ncbi:spermidine synthase [Parvularcula flava]|uniref:Spermidine synthase n=1 Tax=Aquisalinus luteolus TaxID=1566827 RepID=A0A8J3A259_9PROT|nr:spermidine synthase [Aquisalinus luteolus]NHK28099.1 spermidine synthase [Aquisalinus luteolus]GGH97454.1 spermidine synthase [Aquisalinus luteolus]
MSRLFEELDYQHTPIGMIALRRRFYPALDRDIYEIILRDEHLMSDAFTASESALARLGLEACKGDKLDVLVGGLGLGYTASAVLEDSRVASLTISEYLAPVIDWHCQGLVPLDPPLAGDERVTFAEQDFFARAASEGGFDDAQPGRQFDAILVDIDHSPEALLNDGNAGFYTPDGLAALARHLKPGGVFGLWSDDRPDERFTSRLQSVFASASAEPVTFHNPLQDKPFTQTVYLARKA